TRTVMVLASTLVTERSVSSVTTSGATAVLSHFPTRRSSDLGGAYHHGTGADSSLLCSGRFGGVVCLQRRYPLSPGEGEQCFHLQDRKSTRLNSSHVKISYAVFCLKKK